MSYLPGQNSSFTVKITNLSKRGTQNVEAKLRTSVYMATNLGDIIPITDRNDAFTPGQAQSFTWNFTVPASFGGASGQIIVRVFDPGNNILSTITQNFTVDNPPPAYTLNISISGSGTVSKNPNKATYNSGEQVNIVAVPSQNYVFSYWLENGNTDTYPNINVIMLSNRQITAVFTYNPPPPPPPTYTLTTGVKSGSGTITRIPNKSVFSEGETVNLTATPANGWVFSYWDIDNGADYDSYYDIYVMMLANHVIRAVFERM